MKTRFDKAGHWVGTRGNESSFDCMETSHLLNIYCMFQRYPSRVMSMLLADVESERYSSRVWSPNGSDEDKQESVHNITSMSADDLVDYAFNSPLGISLRLELEDRGVNVENALEVLKTRDACYPCESKKEG